MSNGIKYQDAEIRIDMDYLVNAMSGDDIKAFIKGIALDDFVIQKVVDYICDEDEDGFWTGASNNIREEILRRVEKTQLSKSLRYNWSFLEIIERKLKAITANRSMYYKIYHDEWLEEKTKQRLLDGVECEYKTKEADENISAIYKLMEQAMATFEAKGDE